MRPKGSAEVLEDRRRRGLALLQRGLSLNAAARQLGCAASSVMRWRDAVRQHGRAGLTVSTHTGAAVEVDRGPAAAGGPGPGQGGDRPWVPDGAVDDGADRRGDQGPVRRRPQLRDHVGRLMHTLGWSHQKPETRALERDEGRIAHWKRREWPRVKKTLRGWVPTSSSSTNRASC